MSAERRPVTEEQREAALAALRGQELGAIVEATHLLSADRSTTARLVELLGSESRPEVRQGILYALAWHGDLGTWDLMVRIVADTQETPTV